MPKNIRFIATFVSLVSLQTAIATAEPHHFAAPIRVPALITNQAQSTNHVNHLKATPPRTRDVFVMNVPLTNTQKHLLQTFPDRPLTSTLPLNEPFGLPQKVELGMNNVPVLDQGMHGTCATFATVAAIDAILNKGDYISPLCMLEAGDYLETRSYYPSGWNGSWGTLVLERISEFGIISMENQRIKSCAGITEYPATDLNNTGTAMSLDEYISLSEDLNDHIFWYPILTELERFSTTNPFSAILLMEKTLMTVKSSLAAKDAREHTRLTIGVILPVNHCNAGACGSYHQTGDTWVISKGIRNDQEPEYGGHEMVITGYNDQAIVTDNEGMKHKGVLVLRNSWGDQHGDRGDFYMSYDFFKQYTLEVQAVIG